MPEPKSNCSLEIDLAAIAGNLAFLRARLPAGVRVAGVVKSDAYGHGLLPVARCLKAEGCEALAVSHLHEVAELRRAEVTGPILVLLGMEPGQAARAVELAATVVTADPAVLAALAEAGDPARPARALLKVETGMNRLGARPAEALARLEEFARRPGLALGGILSHLATAGVPDCPHAAAQGRVFAALLAAAAERGLALPESSLLNSGGILLPPPGAPPAPALVRPGIGLYGGLPDPACADLAKPLRGAMRLTTRLWAVRPVPAGGAVSYGRTWLAPRDSLLGVLPVGYADGYPRAASNRGAALVGGRRAPQVGRVCMNLMMVDLTDHRPMPRAGDEVVLLGSQGKEAITLDELAGWAGTIGYETACALGAANPARRYRA